MDRLILQPGAIPLDTDGGSIQRNAMIALGYLAQAAFGTSTVADGLACTPTTPASMVVDVGQGSIFMLSTIDATNFGSLALDNTDPLVKVGINAVGVTPFTLTAPGTSGQSINYLIEATLQESDGTPVVLPYYNPANPSLPYSGPSNSGVAQNTVRSQKVELQLKAGVAATTGTQTTPAVDSGWVGLYVITVNFGALTVIAGNISQYPGAPFIPAKLGVGSLFGFSHTQVFNSSGTFNVPNGVTKIRARVLGAGGSGSGGNGSTTSGGGGGAGGYTDGIFTVTPGQAISVTVGTGGAGVVAGSNGNPGGSSSIGALASATGGVGAGTSGGVGGVAGGSGGVGTGGALTIVGGSGSDGSAVVDTNASGIGGVSFFGGGGRAGAGGGVAGQAPGSGGGGSYSATAGSGASGANGIVIVEW